MVRSLTGGKDRPRPTQDPPEIDGTPYHRTAKRSPNKSINWVDHPILSSCSSQIAERTRFVGPGPDGTSSGSDSQVNKVPSSTEKVPTPPTSVRSSLRKHLGFGIWPKGFWIGAQGSWSVVKASRTTVRPWLGLAAIEIPWRDIKQN